MGARMDCELIFKKLKEEVKTTSAEKKEEKNLSLLIKSEAKADWATPARPQWAMLQLLSPRVSRFGISPKLQHRHKGR